MRTDSTRIHTLAAIALLGMATVSFAQSPAPVQAEVAAPVAVPGTLPVVPAPKPTVETATTPVEQIRLGGKTLPLNIKTLAEVQRLTEEKALREQIQESLKTGGAVQISTSSLPAVTPAGDAAVKPVASSNVITKRAKSAAPSNTLVAVFGPAGNLQAEVQVGAKEVRQLRAGDTYGSYRVASISQGGVQLESTRGGQSSRFVPVGQQLAK